MGPPEHQPSASRVRPVGPGTAAACAVLGLVLLWRLPALAGVADYLGIVATGVATAALFAAVRLLTGHQDGRAPALGVALMALAGQVLNAWVGLPAASELRGHYGWAGVLALVGELTVVGLALRDRAAAAARPPGPR